MFGEVRLPVYCGIIRVRINFSFLIFSPFPLLSLSLSSDMADDACRF